MNKKLLQLDTDEFCQWLDTPIGRVIVYANNSDLVKIDIIPSLIFLKDPTNKVVVNENKQPISPKPNWLTEKAIEQVESYFAGELTAFDLPIPFSDDSFCNRACLNLYNNYFGQTISYKQLATVTGNSRASRAAGHAMSSNPVPIVVPCHRVLASNGSLGGFLYGLKMKTWLIKHEQKTMIRLKAQSIHEFSDDEVSKLLSVESLKPMFAKNAC